MRLFKNNHRKVYCEQCKQFKFDLSNYYEPFRYILKNAITLTGVDRECPLHPKKEYTYIIDSVDAWKKNKHNNCKDFEPIE